MKRLSLCLLGLIGALASLTPDTALAQSFAQEVGNVQVGNVNITNCIGAPSLYWGGDYATLRANGGSATTQPGSIFANQGLNVCIYQQDSLVQQTRDYLQGKTPFLRVTYGMAAIASEVIGKDPRTKGVVLEQLTWSQGDHLVCRDTVRELGDLRGKTIALQKWGPHVVDFLADALDTAGLSYGDVKIKYTKDLTGTNDSPAALLRNDRSVDCAFVVTPDMIGLNTDVGEVGTGAEGTLRGAHVVVSTRQLSRSIADVFVVRKDFYDANRDLVTKFAAGFLKGVESVVMEKRKYGTPKAREYEANILAPAQRFYGNKLLPNLEEAHGLLSDCTFVGQEGNIVFFTGSGNDVGFEALKQRRSAFAKARGFVSQPGELIASSLEWSSNSFVGYLAVTGTGSGTTARFDANRVRDELATMTNAGNVNSHTVYSFTISFDANQTTFSAERYRAEYEKALKLARQYGNATIAIRGHVDPTMTLKTLVEAGLQNGTLTRQGAAGNYTYFHNGNRIDLSNTRAISELIQSGQFDRNVQIGPRQVMQQAQNVALTRAQAVRDSLLDFARSKDVRIDTSQITPQGVGVVEPVIARPRNADEAARNQRVEFAIIRVSAEATKQADFDF